MALCCMHSMHATLRIQHISSWGAGAANYQGQSHPADNGIG